ncbi:MAG TPA: UDP-N-acetylmuramoyl-L-alanine--D-glutamate ligase [Syntrophorhabdaceae bacterium]|nr:UDP-N-acetylmuramoyl-L-alanine--D-glutamate ligase [Syntrophorhabdaceae bacterium]HQM81310.1 UDP-N-acetylmuramoyl-L-alanine--D-glutamate ligase [Syntrophorhabdaceae bacterium]
MNLPDNILIVGLGASGIAAAKFLRGMGKRIAIADEKDEAALAPVLRSLNGVEFTGHFGPHRTEDFLRYPLIVISPGVDSALPVLKEANAKGIRVIGEVELAYMFLDAPVIAITGTNGKTTTTTLIGEIFKKAFGSVFVGGNIGNPLINYALEGKKAQHIIAEISSFQLETVEAFRANTSILLNITEDHLDRYRGYDEYRDAKYRIFERQTEKDYALIIDGLEAPKAGKGRVLSFSSAKVLEEGAFAKDGMLYVRIDGKEFLYERDLSPLVGAHNTENILAALLAAHIYGIDQATVTSVLGEFKGLPHRVELVRELKGVRYYNDSKATNVDATKRALENIEGNVILIAGGKDKGGSYRAIAGVAQKIKVLIVIGEAQDKITGELGSHVVIYKEEDMAGAVRAAYEVAESGDIVLLSPMCSSFDMFTDYKHRGDTYREIVESL